ncbi:hypothetical protein K431DRAFT_315811 [Polychaeton citri CBS 116435]|uniref:Zn(2)-C6 fungal-type domain-containing protein n=1 Tax=Polychaeton citri CBS 116435 TaxID=1314669 RepID=A0A9P4Q2Q8_9PEZI|nr:hypothetical protein K431DRAFT_315811 [Polychaeton citri CBS 116435]
MFQSFHLSDTAASAKRRRNRQPKACQPCRLRKLRCDFTQPCQRCCQREHEDLCVYGKGPEGRRRNNSSLSNTEPSILNEQVQDNSLRDVDSFRTNIHQAHALDQPRALGVYEQDILNLVKSVAGKINQVCETEVETGEILYFGRNSHLAFLNTLLPHVYETRQKQLLPSDHSLASALGLSNRTSLHPFGSLWNATANITLGEILQALPKNDICLKYFYVYMHSVHPFYPFLARPDLFEARLVKVLETKDDPQGADNDQLSHSALDQPVSTMSWYGLLFAVLACGCWFSDTDPASRVLTARVFIASSFECLRFANIYVQPSLDTVQAMLIVEYVIANDSNPGVAWNLLASTIRQAQSIGLHVLNENNMPEQSGEHPTWQMAVNMDAMLSSAFDRVPVTTSPYDEAKKVQALSYSNGFISKLHTLHCIILDWQGHSSLEQRHLPLNNATAKYLEEKFNHVFLLESFTADLLNTTENASSAIQARLEHLVINLKTLHFKSNLTLLLLLDEQRGQSHTYLVETLLNSLRNVLCSFLALNQLSAVASRSWDLLHCALSAALTLAMLDRALDADRYREVLSKVVHSFDENQNKEENEERGSDTDAGVVGKPWKHGVDVLRFLLEVP